MIDTLLNERRSRALHALWSRHWLTALLAIGTALSRWPFVSAGYGLDPDAHRVVNAAWEIARTGRYTASRLPGYPLQEGLLALLQQGGPRLVNGATALLGCLAVVAFSRCLRASGVREHALLALGFAAVPVIYINSTCAMDYVWAVALILCAAHAALRQRPWRAGLWLGLAIGVRITSGAMLLPLALLCAARAPSFRRYLRALTRLTLAALSCGALCFAPVLARYGSKFFTFYDALGGGTAQNILRRGTLGVWGSVGLIALGCAALGMLLTAYRARRRSARQARQWISAACGSAVLLYTIAYLRLPHEAGYLAPLVPFVIWGASLWQTRVPNLLFALLLCAAPFVEASAAGVSLDGPVLSDHAERRAQTRTVRRTTQALRALERPSVLVAGYYLPMLESAGLRKSQTPHQLRALIKRADQVQQLRAAGLDVYYLDGAIEHYQRRWNGISLHRLGARPLPMLP